MQTLFAHQKRRVLIELHNQLSPTVIDDALDFDGAYHIVREASNAIAHAMIDTGKATINSLAVLAVPTVKADIDPVELSDDITQSAVEYAEEHAADMVSGINDTTRSALRDQIRDAVDTGMAVDELADRIADSGIFSDERAAMIARTEISMAQNQGVLEAGIAANDAGANIKKVWTLGPDPCPLCEEAADEGAIDLDDDFGDAGDAPPLHPNCQCSLDLIEFDEDDDDAS